eukprot:232169_1
MGNKTSKQIPKPQIHSCDVGCLIETKKQKDMIETAFFRNAFTKVHTKALQQQLKRYNIGFTVDVILTYLQAAYKLYYHNAISGFYIKGKPPCKRWLHQINIKICLLGLAVCGKTAFVNRWMDNVFTNIYEPTIDDSYKKTITINPNDDDKDKYEQEAEIRTSLHTDYGTKYNCTLNVLDTAGQQIFEAMQEQWIRDSNLFLLFFAINDQKSFNEAILLREKVIRLKMNDNNKYGMMFIATKCDLKYEDEIDQMNGFDLIDDNKIMDFVKINNIPFIETSAKHNINVHFAFRHAVYQYWIQTQFKLN